MISPTYYIIFLVPASLYILKICIFNDQIRRKLLLFTMNLKKLFPSPWISLTRQRVNTFSHWISLLGYLLTPTVKYNLCNNPITINMYYSQIWKRLARQAIVNTLFRTSFYLWTPWACLVSRYLLRTLLNLIPEFCIRELSLISDWIFDGE